MILSIIAAVTKNGVIGSGNKLPWHLPADLKHFKEITMGHPVLMGRKTFESIGYPLPGRKNIILTRDAELQYANCEVKTSLQDAFDFLALEDEVFVIGGGEVYKQVFPFVKRIYLTRIDVALEGDTLFPEINTKKWRLIKSIPHQPDVKNPYKYTFETWEK